MNSFCDIGNLRVKTDVRIGDFQVGARYAFWVGKFFATAILEDYLLCVHTLTQFPHAIMPFSKYFDELPSDVQPRYSQKIVMCDGLDPYSLSKSEFSKEISWPSVQYPNIVN